MRPLDDFPIDPEIAAQLDAIDATLAGEAVDPEFAELAELALLVTVDRPQIDPAFAASLDQLVERRFTAPKAGASAAPGGRGGSRFPRRPRIGLWPAAGGFATALAAVIAVVVVISSGGSSSSPRPVLLDAAPVTAAASGRPAPTAHDLVRESAGAVKAQASVPSAASGAVSSAAVVRSPATAATNFGAALQNTVQPSPNGRKIVQSAQLQLTAAASRIDDVSQELFNVVGNESGIVRHSTVTATGGRDGYAEFQLSVPSAKLADTMRQLSSLHYAHVASRTDSSQDVNDQYVADTRRLADARALRTSLLKQLANATTQTEIDSLKAQIHDAEASIASDEATLRGLQHQISYSQVDVNINAGSIPVTPKPSGSGGFTLGQAAHDAGRVLTVAAGVALITLAALVPIGLLVALGLWIGLTLRRRRREHALDAA